ncbi:MAG: heme A synthase [Cryomorphaceae bacterium]|nr:heme A synthase [Cryomorphaceae bacterium]
MVEHVTIRQSSRLKQYIVTDGDWGKSVCFFVVNRALLNYNHPVGTVIFDGPFFLSLFNIDCCQFIDSKARLLYLRNMNLERWIKRTAWVSLVMVYLVIIAGSVVRMTGSGMGCPDWPKCFGFTIPPTNIDEVSWHAAEPYNAGRMIVRNDTLWVAQSTFVSGPSFEQSNWKPYDKHDYAIFNPMHTWVEFINRLIGALTGIPVLMLFILSFLFAVRHKKWFYWISSNATLFMLGFEAWLGKLVVDGNLIPGSITIHMLGSAVLIFLLLAIIRQSEVNINVLKTQRLLMFGGLFLLVSQIILGTQVRELVDDLLHSGVERGDALVGALPSIFTFHRSFSWLNVLIFLFWFRSMKKQTTAMKEVHVVGAMLFLQLLAGITLTYGGMPQAMQPVHLLSALIMLGAYWSAWVRTRTNAPA